MQVIIMSLRKFKRNRRKKLKMADPAAGEHFFVRGVQLAEQGDNVQAEACLRKAVKNDAGHGYAWNSLGNILHSRGNLQEALACYRKCCEVLPHTAVCFFNYGTSLYEAGAWDEAEESLVKAVLLQPDYVEAYVALGSVRRLVGDTNGAVNALQQALSMQPECAEAHRILGLALKDRGDIVAGLKCFRKSIEYFPDDALSHYLITRYKKYTSADDPDIGVFNSLLNKAGLSHENAYLLHFGLGKIYDDLALYKKAFQHYQLANQLKRNTLGVGWVTTGIELDRYTRVFIKSLFKRFIPQHDEMSSELPVFVVGMPRSGTTLVEQICATHSQIYGRGELNKIFKLTNELPVLCGGKGDYPENLVTISPSCIRSLAEKYLLELKRGLPEGISRIVDKTPANFKELGFIAILFPGARIVHCVRDPLDTCLSNYFQSFEEGNECSYDLETLSLYYRKYSAIMHYWEAVLPNKFHTVEYESLVSNPEKEIKELVEFLGLSWEKSCLSFHKTKRNVQSSSDWQVRQALYNKSVARWKNYEPYIGKLIEGLESTGRLL